MKHNRMGPFGTQDFAAFRSHQDAQTSNDNARAASQAAILINGGAATALLAFLAKEKVDAYYLTHIPFGLAGYALGVFCGAWMVFFDAQALKWWGMAWRTYMRDVTDPKASDEQNTKAWRWKKLAVASFAASMLCFVASSAALSYIFFYAPALK